MILSEENRIVNSLWIGNKLSSIELLTLYSFVENGHEFHLWIYEPLQNNLPSNIILRDANEIIPENYIFRRKYDDPESNIGKGSVGSPFSDLFRYKLLYEVGGWWVDMDVTCLKALEISEPYFFRAHPLLPMIGNVMKVPRKSELMELTYQEVKNTCNAETLEWLLPNKILNQYILNLNLTKFIRSDFSVDDWWAELNVFIKTDRNIPENWRFIHWMNEEWGIRKMDKELVYSHTTIGKLFEKYNLKTKRYPFLLKWWTKLRLFYNE